MFTAFRYAQFDGLPSKVLEVAQQYNALENYLYIQDVPSEYQAPLVHAYMEAVRNVVSHSSLCGIIVCIQLIDGM